MPISENALHPYIKGLVEDYGELTVTDINVKLREVLELDSDDLAPLQGRSDDKFSQIVRNVVAHASEGISTRNGYIIDKTRKPAKFYAISTMARQRISPQEITQRQERKRQFRARRINFAELNLERTILGDSGERFALDWERNRLRELGVTFDVIDEVIHFSKKYGDGSGYDIQSRKDGNFELLYIEVKTTKRGLNEPFYLSENEKIFMELYSDKARIYRVYNFNMDTNIGEIEIITYNDLIANFTLDPITYKVTRNT